MTSAPARPTDPSGPREPLLRRPGAALLPLRAFLAVVFLYAGLSKIADRSFLDADSPTGIKSTTQAVKSASPIGGLLQPVIDHSFAFGLLMALAETAVGIGLALGLFTRIAAAGGMLLTLSLWLTVSWQSDPWYTGADIGYVFALTPLLLVGITPFSLDEWLARTRARGARDSDFATRRVILAGAAAVTGLVAVGAASLFRKSGSNRDSGTSDTGSSGDSGSGSNGATTIAASDVPVGGGKQITDKGSGAAVWVLQLESGQFTAFDAACPHQGCPVKFENKSDGFACPCHGSKFAADGAVTHGPANRALTKRTVTQTGDQLSVG